MDAGVTESGLGVTLTIQLLMHRKEVGSIIGKKGESVRRIREESGVRISISEGNCPERIITLTGPTNAIFKAFAMIDKLEEDINSSMTNSTAASRPPVTPRLVVLATQCGDLMGKVVVRAKRSTRVRGPRPSSPVICAGGQDRCSDAAGYLHATHDLEGPPLDAYSIQGQHTISPLDLAKLNQVARQQSHFAMMHRGTRFAGIDSSSPEVKGYWASLDASTQTTHELTIPNNLIGCIIGHQGTNINEICQLSGAQIKTANPVEGSSGR
ncbi:Poly(Rc)-Binding Protein 1 [Manis pentadactyla]|nr:Poly(Rc)-Binding Protein 1 [Manis pentadactyla]